MAFGFQLFCRTCEIGTLITSPEVISDTRSLRSRRSSSLDLRSYAGLQPESLVGRDRSDEHEQARLHPVLEVKIALEIERANSDESGRHESQRGSHRLRKPWLLDDCEHGREKEPRDERPHSLITHDPPRRESRGRD